MKIGTDVNMSINISEGYQIMEFKKRELFKNGVLQPDVDCRFYRHLPDHVLMDMYGTENPVGQPRLYEDGNYSANELWEMYLEDKEGIDSFVGDTHNFPQNESELLNLASDISSFKGLT